MILNPLSRLKVAAETIAKASSSVPLPPSFFFASLHGSPESDSIYTIEEFVASIPEAVRKRKVENIEPGAPNDPVSRLFRYVTFLYV
jgi:hypothetical protein